MKHVYSLSMYGIFLLVFAHELTGFSNTCFTVLTALVMPVFLIASLSLSRGFQFYISLISLAAGHILILYYDLDFHLWHQSITTGMAMPLLFVVIPLISFPILNGPYLSSLEQLAAARKNHPGFMFLFLSVLYLMMAITLNIGVIPTIKKMVSGIRFPKQFLSLLYMTGSASYMIFSPYDAVVILILIYTGLSYAQYFLTASLMSLFIMGTALIFLIINRSLKLSVKERLEQMESRPASLRPLFTLIAHILVMILLACLGDRIFPFSSPVYGIALIILVYSLFWCATIGAWGRLTRFFRGYSENFTAYAGFLPFLISASFLGAVFSGTPLKAEFLELINTLHKLPLYLEVQLLILLTVLLALCGIHMLIPVTAMAMSLTPEMIGLTPPGFALMLLTCWFNAMIISPFVPFVVVSADTLGVSPLNVSARYNFRFSLVMILFSPLAVTAVDRINLLFQ